MDVPTKTPRENYICNLLDTHQENTFVAQRDNGKPRQVPGSAPGVKQLDMR